MRRMRRSRVTFATMEAAAMDSEVASPLMMVSPGTMKFRRQVVAVHQRVRGAHRQRVQRAAHGGEGRLADVDAVDLAGRRKSDRDGDGARQDALIGVLALLDRKNLGIGKALGKPVGIENDGGCGHRAGQRTAPRLVHSRHRPDAGAHQRALSAKVRIGWRLAWRHEKVQIWRELGSRSHVEPSPRTDLPDSRPLCPSPCCR